MIRKLEKLLYNIRSTEGNEGENESVVDRGTGVICGKRKKVCFEFFVLSYRPIHHFIKLINSQYLHKCQLAG